MAAKPGYYLSHRYGRYFLQVMGGEELPLDLLQRIIADLQQQALGMQSGETITTMVDDHLQQCLARIERAANWWLPGSDTNPNALGNCVYFIGVDTRPGQIKIGFTTNFKGRMRGLWNKHQRSTLCLYAAAETPEYLTYEAALHWWLGEHRIDGEWFEREPVVRYLAQITKSNPLAVQS